MPKYVKNRWRQTSVLRVLREISACSLARYPKCKGCFMSRFGTIHRIIISCEPYIASSSLFEPS